MATALEQALEDVYTSLNNENEDIDNKIKSLKEAAKAAEQKEITMVPERLPQNNRQGRKMLQTYFKKRGVLVSFDK